MGHLTHIIILCYRCNHPISICKPISPYYHHISPYYPARTPSAISSTVSKWMVLPHLPWTCFVAQPALAMALFSTTPHAFPNWRSLAIEWQGYDQDPQILWSQDVTCMFCFRSTSMFVHFCWVLDTQSMKKGEIIFFKSFSLRSGGVIRFYQSVIHAPLSL